MRAAEQDTSISALIERFLIDLAAGGSHAAERLKHEERVLRKRVGSFAAGNRLSRDQTHDRRAAE